MKDNSPRSPTSRSCRVPPNPHPPLYAAALSPESYDWAARKGYSILQVPYPLPIEVTQGQIAAYKEKLGQHGHGGTEVIALFHTYVGETAARAKAEAEQAVMNYVNLAGSLFPKKIKSEQYKSYAQFAPTMQTLTYDVLYNERTLIGDPDQVIAKLERFQKDLQMDQSSIFSTGVGWTTIWCCNPCSALQICPAPFPKRRCPN